MNGLIWTFQGLLAAVFFMAGFLKESKSKAELKEMRGETLAWVDDVSAGKIKLIGILELMAAFGLILPQLTGILPWLPPFAAVGLALMMIGALMLNVRKRNKVAIMENIVLLILAAFVAYGRFILVPG